MILSCFQDIEPQLNYDGWENTRKDGMTDNPNLIKPPLFQSGAIKPKRIHYFTSRCNKS